MKLKIFIHTKYDEYSKEHTFYAFNSDMTSMGYMLVEEREIDFTPPPREVLVNGVIETYREQQQKIRARAEVECNRLQQHINDMLSLEYKPEAANAATHDNQSHGAG